MVFHHWMTLVGVLLIGMVLIGSVLKRLPLTSAVLYLFIGVALGPWGAGVLRLDPVQAAAGLERLTEIAVAISLFTAGLKLRAPLRDTRWRLPLRLASVSMLVTVGLLMLVGVYGLGLPWGAAVLLGAVLAPTDPVLASDVQVAHAGDRDRLRFGLTGEAGLNDGTAFPLLMLGLGWLGLHELGAYGWRWWVVDVVWAVTGGALIGWLLGWTVGHFVLYLRRQHREAVGLEDFLTLGVIALSYGMAVLLRADGFLAVFAAGLVLRRIEQQTSGQTLPASVATTSNTESEKIATDPEKAPAYMAQAMLGFTEQLERIAELTIVLLLGGMLTAAYLPSAALWFVPLFFFIIRPLAVTVALVGADSAGLQRSLLCWFGIRGIGSLYYLMYAIRHGLPPALAQQLTALTFTVVAASIVAHGISVTPLMNVYRRVKQPVSTARGT